METRDKTLPATYDRPVFIYNKQSKHQATYKSSYGDYLEQYCNREIVTPK
jgi:hypothetical protein